LIRNILDLDADILSLQELDDYWTFFRPRLDEHGWGSIYGPRPSLHISSWSGKRKNDGCSIFYRKSKLEVVEVEIVNYSDDHDRVALIALFKVIGVEKDSYILICTTHLYWNSKKVDIQLKELKELDEALRGIAITLQEKYKIANIPLIVSGDFSKCISTPINELCFLS
jgi:CCR4-NOT transcription complex subunit 6